MSAASLPCSSTPDMWNLTFQSLAIRQTLNVSDGSLWVARQSGKTFDVADASHLYLAPWEMKSAFLCHSHCAHWSHRWGGGLEVAGRGQMRPHLDRPRILPVLTLVARAAPCLSPSKDACPLVRPEQAASPMSPLASLLPVREAKSGVLNPRDTHQRPNGVRGC